MMCPLYTDIHGAQFIQRHQFEKCLTRPLTVVPNDSRNFQFQTRFREDCSNSQKS